MCKWDETILLPLFHVFAFHEFALLEKFSSVSFTLTFLMSCSLLMITSSYILPSHLFNFYLTKPLYIFVSSYTVYRILPNPHLVDSSDLASQASLTITITLIFIISSTLLL